MAASVLNFTAALLALLLLKPLLSRMRPTSPLVPAPAQGGSVGVSVPAPE
jgi:hypothetical protein